MIQTSTRSKLQILQPREENSLKNPKVGPPSGFKARKMPNFSNPFVPIVGQNRPTMPKRIVLHSQEQAFKRQEFQERLKQKQKQKDKENQSHLKAKKIREKEEVKEMRQKMQFRARKAPSQDLSLLRDFISHFTVSETQFSFDSGKSTCISFSN